MQSSGRMLRLPDRSNVVRAGSGDDVLWQVRPAASPRAPFEIPRIR